VLSGRARPQTEAVVMFARQNNAVHTARLQCSHNRIGIESGRIEDPRIFVTLAPLSPGKCIHREMEKAVSLQFVPAKLAPRGQSAIGRQSERIRRPKTYRRCSA
jgi:nitrite reductase/ring-hydroxylating ferredoxin subunit